MTATEMDESYERISFRRPKILSRRLALRVVSILAGGAIGLSVVPSARLNPNFLIGAGAYLAVVAVVLVGRLIYHRSRGGAAPITFESDGLSIPLSVQSLRTARILYEDLRSAIIMGKGNRANLILDTRKRAYVYPIREFAIPEAGSRFLETLHRRIAARADGAAQNISMAERAAVAGYFARHKPWATWALLGILALVYLGEALWLHRADALGLLDLGANAAVLVRQGEWFRLVTANLLHANALHVLNNALFALIMGTLVERQLGTRRFLILVLSTGIISQGVSALWASLGWFSSYLYSVGISGALFGILGAQAVLNRRFGTQLPGGYRFAPRVWWILLGLNFGVLPFIFPALDNAAHVGGLISGAAIGWLLCLGQTDVTHPPPWHPIARLTLGALGLVWMAAIALAIDHGIDPDTRRAERTQLIDSVAEAPGTKPALDNDLAWLLATEALPTPHELDDALILANRAVAHSGAATGGKPVAQFTDTLATVHYRRGEFETAVALEHAIATETRTFASQLARFMAAAAERHDGHPLGDDAGTSPVLALDPVQEPLTDLAVALQSAGPFDQGAEIYALIEQGPQPRAVLRIALPPGTRRTRQHFAIHLKPGFGVAADLLRNATIRVLGLDPQGCNCSLDHPYAWIFAYDTDIAALP